ncbi:hypothetical protein SANTM175S_05661 [Streptomyces antimycoticus]
MVATPDIMIARLGSSPISTGATKLAPNMATTCCAPSPAVLGHDSRSSGLTTAPGAGVRPSPCRVQRTPRPMTAPLHRYGEFAAMLVGRNYAPCSYVGMPSVTSWVKSSASDWASP